MKKHWLFGSALLTAGLLLGGCGDSKDASTEEEKNKTEEASADETASTAKQTEVSEGEKYAQGYKDGLYDLTQEQLDLSDTSYNFIKENYKLLPANTEEDIKKAKELTDSSINAKMLNKNSAPYFEKFLTFEGNVVDVQEEPSPSGDVTVSLTHVYDDNGQSYQVVMYKGTGDILEEDRVRFWGVPVGGSSFENVSGGATNVQNFIGSHIEKVQ